MVAIIGRRSRVLADVEMICVGLSAPVFALRYLDAPVHQRCRRDRRGAGEGTTRAVQAMRQAHRQGLVDGAIVASATPRRAHRDRAPDPRRTGTTRHRHRMPVGFVSAAESKDLMATLDDVPWVVIRGRKGGSTLVVAAITRCSGWPRRASAKTLSRWRDRLMKATRP